MERMEEQRDVKMEKTKRQHLNVTVDHHQCVTFVILLER